MAQLKSFILAIITVFVLAQCTSKQVYKISVSNNSDTDFIDYPIEIPLAELKLNIQNIDVNNVIVKDEDMVLQTEVVTKNKQPYLIIMITVKSKSAKTLAFYSIPEENKPIFPKRTQAEIAVKQGGEWQWVTKKNGNEQFEYKRGEFKNVSYYKVPKEHTDHSFDIKYEGPGWESDKVGYRFYLDWRNAVDIFGKHTPETVLQQVGLDGFDSYHEPADWGMDIFKVGSSLGLGSIGCWNGEKAIRVEKTDGLESKVILNGNLKSAIKTNYLGWEILDKKVTLSSEISIYAGSRLTHQKLSIEGETLPLCTGIIKHKNIAQQNNFNDSSKEWLYLSTYGEQSLAKDNLGLAIVVNRKFVKEITQDKNNHIVVLQPINNKVDYYFLAAWEQEPNGIKTQSDFNNYINQLIKQMESPLTIKN